MTAGSWAGRKAVIVRNYDEGTEARRYPHAIVAGVARYPKAGNYKAKTANFLPPIFVVFLMFFFFI